MKDYKKHKNICSSSSNAKSEDLSKHFKMGFDGSFTNEFHTTADAQRIFAEAYGRRYKLKHKEYNNKVRKYIIDKIKTWDKQIFKELQEINLEFINDDNDFHAIGILFYAKDIMFETAIPPPKYITISFLVFKQFPKNIYMKFTDDPQGILSIMKNNRRICDDNDLVFGEKTDYCMKTYPIDGGIYSLVDWNTGKILDKSGSIEDF